MKCKIYSLVSESVASMDESRTVQEGVALMAQKNVGSLVITGSDGVTGLFTERDLLNRVISQGKDPSNLKLGEVCTRDLVSISSESSCQEAIKKMHIHVCRSLVVYRGERFMGLVNLQTVAKALADKSSRNNLLVNVIGGVTFAAAVGVIALLLYNLPNMMQLADKVTSTPPVTHSAQQQ